MTDFISLDKNNYEDAFQLQCLCHSHPWSRNTFIDSLSTPYFAFALTETQNTQGFYLGLQVLQEVTLMDIGVHPDCRGMGVGRRLMMHFVDVCQRRGADQVWLEVRVSNEAAIHLYKTFGFDVVERRKNYYPSASGREDALMMTLKLLEGN
ncbi:Ribosomal-protein-alanine N-acetyltransferase [Saliniradius amylolyticus]|uniref:[Ribosomal protein bS18]-alanine N-acetyltransferase n=1 Tax=Saliniradius amylolyticus TaxID=2183582 RepID=A0A2S2E4F6_9ALTE|nr:ribosomal protein S18-alanine N-acetyltransferase [Saliniradius amylolyticus]AWL12513.1 Ribosomal-protein-alanine N-acetyltransferase [Saliniradius amylolyticus]